MDRRLTPEHNVEAIVTRSTGQRLIGRHCEGCGERDSGAQFDGGRYGVHTAGVMRWLCVECYVALWMTRA